MRRVVSLLGTFLMVAGLGILVYVGVAYERQRSSASTPHWSATQQQQGRQIAQELGKGSTGHGKKRAAGPPPGSETGIRIVIPKIHVNAPIVETTPVQGEWAVADWAAGHLEGTANPGGRGNDALAAHDDIKGEIFKRIGELRPGDAIRLYTHHAVYTYSVTDQQSVDPSDTSVLLPTKVPYVTLITCEPYWVDTQRLIVQGVLKQRAAI